MGQPKVKALCVATRCATTEQFIATFHRFCDERSFFVATLNARPIGLETPFSIQLSDRTPVLRGTCTVQAAWTNSDNPYRRPGIQLAIQRLTPESEPIFKQLQAARATPGRAPTSDVFTETPRETPVSIMVPPIPPATNTTPRRPPTAQLPVVGRAPTARRAVEPVAVIAAPPKSPPEVKLLEVILPPPKQPPPTTVEQSSEPTNVTQLEQRTPGSELILPANPLQNLTDESLEGFVDCTLYEETATFFRSPEDGREIDALAEPPRPVVPALPAAAIDDALQGASGLFALQPSGEMVPLVVENPATGQLDPIVVPAAIEGRARTQTGQLLAPELRPQRLTGPQMPIPVSRTRTGTIPPIVVGRTSTGTIPPQVVMTASQMGPLPTMTASQVGLMPMPPSHVGPLPTPEQPNMMRKFLGDENVQTPVPAGEAFVALPSRHVDRRSRLAPLVVIGGAALGATLIVVLVLVTRSSASDGRDAGATPPPKVVTQPVVVEAKPAPAPAKPKPAVVETTEVTEPGEPAGPPLVGEGACKLEVTTTPAGTMVSFDGRAVGPSPITIAGSCAGHKVELLHPRYKAEQRFVTMTADKPVTLDVSLVRPTHQLRVLTRPAGAEVYISGRRAGTTPTMVQVNGFSGIDVRIERVGFKPVSKRVYSKVPDDTLAVGLDPLPRPR